jgi:hypothetical protein
MLDNRKIKLTPGDLQKVAIEMSIQSLAISKQPL